MSTRLRIKVAFVLALMCWTISNASFAEGDTTPEPNRVVLLQEYFASIEARAQRNWEPGNLLLNGDSAVRFTINPDGTFAQIALVENLGNPQSDFASLEAVSETSGFLKLPFPVNEPLHKTIRLRLSERTVTCDCAKEFLENYPRVNKQSIVWHLIPLEALQRCQTLSPAIVHSQKNLRLIKNGSANSSEMSAARADWAAFLHDSNNLSQEKITDEAKRIEQKYAAMFDRIPLGTDRTSENARLAFGYINRRGSIQIAPKYDQATEFVDGVALVSSKRIVNTPVWEGINRDGVKLFEALADSMMIPSYQKYPWVASVLQGKAPNPKAPNLKTKYVANLEVYSDGQILHQVFETTGKVLWANSKSAYEKLDMTKYAEQSRILSEQAKNAELDKAKAMFLEHVEDYGMAPKPKIECDHCYRGPVISSFSDGLARVRGMDLTTRSDVFLYVDQSGKPAFKLGTNVVAAGDFHEGLASVTIRDTGYNEEGFLVNTRTGFIDKTGQFVVTPKYSGCHDFSEGLAAVESGLYQSGLWGFIDKTGQVVVPCQFADVSDFHDGLAAFHGLVRFDDKVIELSDQDFGYQMINEYLRAYAKVLEKGLSNFHSPRVIRFEVCPDYYHSHKPTVKIISDNLTEIEKEHLRTKIQNVVPPPIGIWGRQRSPRALGFTLFRGHVARAYTREDPQAELIMKRIKLREDPDAYRNNPRSHELRIQITNLDLEINDHGSAGPIGFVPLQYYYHR